MKSFVVLLLCAPLLLAGCAATGRLSDTSALRIPSRASSPAVKEAIDGLLADSLFPPANAAIRIVSLMQGDTLYDLNPRLLLTPASNQKLLTSSTALTTLGPAYEFATAAFIDTAGERVYIRGGGDPVLTSANIDSLAATLRSSLPPGHEWTLAADMTRFDDLWWGNGWVWDDDPDPTAMAISPLSVNGNTIEVNVRSGQHPGDSLAVQVNPLTSYVQIDNSGVTVADTLTRPLDVTRRWRERSNVVVVEGEMLPDDSIQVVLNVVQPEWYALTLLRERLEQRGVRCAGLLIDSLPPGLPETGRIVHRLDSVVIFMNKVSDNLSAECLAKTLGAERSGLPGSTAHGAVVTRQFLASLGVDTTRLVLADGSGVSRYNLVSPAILVRLLDRMYRDPQLFPLFLSSLPIAGVDGTLQSRMRGTAAQGNLRAKTGTLSGVSSLSGYVTTADGEVLAFSMIMEFFPGASRPYRQVQDRIGDYLARLKRSEL